MSNFYNKLFKRPLKSLAHKLFKPTPRGRLWLGFIGIIILSLIAATFALPKGPEWVISLGEKVSKKIFQIETPPEKPSKFKEKLKGVNLHLGLDLKGGSHLVYEANVSGIPSQDRSSALEGARDVIERRVNALGTSEPLVQTNWSGDLWRVIIELPGIQNTAEAIKVIGETPLLEFKEENPQVPKELTPEEKKEMEEYNEKAKTKTEEILKDVLKRPDDFANLANQYSEDPGNQEKKGGDLGWFKKGMMIPEFEKAVFDELKVGEITPELVKTLFGYHIIKKTDERSSSPKATDDKEVRASHILIRTKSESDLRPPTLTWKDTGLTGKELKRAQVFFSPQTNQPQVGLEFNDEGKKLFSQITERNVNRMVAIFLDGYPISIPRVQEPIRDGRAVITGDFTLKEVKQLTERLNAGALPVPISLIQQENVGPSLGKIAVERSFLAGIIGLLFLSCFMIFYYRLPGFLSVIALGIYILILLSLFKLIPVVLTLAGIAGFILSLGMAVDANVLIFERIKEELRLGKPLSSAIDEGFKRAWTSIRDSNISSLLTCFILGWFGTSIVKGFAITLGVGIIVSMFSAIFVSRTFLKLWGKEVGLKFWEFKL